MFCQNCGNEIEGNFCSNCGWSPHRQEERPAKRSNTVDSVLSIVSCALTGVSIFFMPILSVGGIVCGLVDLCISDRSKKHIGSWFGLIMGIIVMIVYITYINDIIHNPLKLFR